MVPVVDLRMGAVPIATLFCPLLCASIAIILTAISYIEGVKETLHLNAVKNGPIP
jgi:hypothetical protein